MKRVLLGLVGGLVALGAPACIQIDVQDVEDAKALLAATQRLDAPSAEQCATFGSSYVAAWNAGDVVTPGLLTRDAERHLSSGRRCWMDKSFSRVAGNPCRYASLSSDFGSRPARCTANDVKDGGTGRCEIEEVPGVVALGADNIQATVAGMHSTFSSPSLSLQDSGVTDAGLCVLRWSFTGTPQAASLIPVAASVKEKRTSFQGTSLVQLDGSAERLVAEWVYSEDPWLMVDTGHQGKHVVR